VGAVKMAFPALACAFFIYDDVETENQPCPFAPAHASSVGVEQFSIKREILPIIVRYLPAWRDIPQHKKLQM
jgi:hypothetical protein